MNSQKQDQSKGIKVKTQVKSGGLPLNNNEKLASDIFKGIRVKSRLKPGGLPTNHNLRVLSPNVSPRNLAPERILEPRGGYSLSASSWWRR